MLSNGEPVDITYKVQSSSHHLDITYTKHTHAFALKANNCPSHESVGFSRKFYSAAACQR